MAKLLITAIENFVLFNTVLALACFALASTVKVVNARAWCTVKPHTLSRVYSGAIVAPSIAAAWIVATALLPEWWLGEAAFNSAHPGAASDLHLMGEFTASLEPTLAYLTLSFVIVAVIFAAWSSWRGYVRVGQMVKRLDLNADPPSPNQVAILHEYAGRYDLDVGLVMSSYPLSFVWGFLRAKVIFSTGLLKVLTEDELRGVLEHEIAHHQRRDNLVKLTLSVCGYGSLVFPLSRLLLTWLAIEVEKICDEVAVSRTQAPLEIANALVKLRKRTAVSPVVLKTAASGLLSIDTVTFELRVHRLVGFVDTPPAAANKSNLTSLRTSRLLVLMATFSASIIAMTLFSPLAVHRGVEFLLHILG